MVWLCFIVKTLGKINNSMVWMVNILNAIFDTTPDGLYTTHSSPQISWYFTLGGNKIEMIPSLPLKTALWHVLSAECLHTIKIIFLCFRPSKDLTGPKHCSKFYKSDAGGGDGAGRELLFGSCWQRFNFSTVGKIKTFSCLKHDF